MTYDFTNIYNYECPPCIPKHQRKMTTLIPSSSIRVAFNANTTVPTVAGTPIVFPNTIFKKGNDISYNNATGVFTLSAGRFSCIGGSNKIVFTSGVSANSNFELGFETNPGNVPIDGISMFANNNALSGFVPGNLANGTIVGPATISFNLIQNTSSGGSVQQFQNYGGASESIFAQIERIE